MYGFEFRITYYSISSSARKALARMRQDNWQDTGENPDYILLLLRHEEYRTVLCWCCFKNQISQLQFWEIQDSILKRETGYRYFGSSRFHSVSTGECRDSTSQLLRPCLSVCGFPHLVSPKPHVPNKFTNMKRTPLRETTTGRLLIFSHVHGFESKESYFLIISPLTKALDRDRDATIGRILEKT